MSKFDGHLNNLKNTEVGIMDKIEKFPHQQYVIDTLFALENSQAKIFDHEMVLAGSQKRKLNMPKPETSKGSLRGVWRGTVFVLDDNFVPKKHNHARDTIGQIKRKLFENFGISIEGIPYVDGVADFSVISVANISVADIVTRAKGISYGKYESLSQWERSELFQEVFKKGKRETNFQFADQIASEKQIPIPGLTKGYTADQIKKWRENNEFKFSWDEQVNGGYNLVPTIIHGNLSHTGLVSVSKNAYSFLKKRDADMKAHPEKYCWNEEEAPIAIGDLWQYRRTAINKRGGNSNLGRNRYNSFDMNLGGYGEIEYSELDKEASDLVKKNMAIHELGVKLEVDKTKLEDEIEKVQAANISNKDKAPIIAELNMAIKKLQEQYEENVALETAKVQEDMQNRLERMGEVADVYEEQENSLRNVTMKAALTDASAAADVAADKKQEIQRMMEEYDEIRQNQIEQAERQSERILKRRSGGQ